MNLVFNMPVTGSDGLEAGWLDRVLVDPERREVTHVAIRSPRVSEEVLLPLNLVQGNAGDRLLLMLDSSDLTNMPRYYDGRTSRPPAGRVDASFVREPAGRRQSLEDALNVSPNALEYGPKTRVAIVDGRAGRLVGLATGQYVNEITEIRVGGLGAHDIVVPAPWIGELRSDAIVVSATSDQIDHLVGAPAAQYLAEEPDKPQQG